jgi:hypothetical protein
MSIFAEASTSSASIKQHKKGRIVQKYKVQMSE